MVVLIKVRIHIGRVMIMAFGRYVNIRRKLQVVKGSQLVKKSETDTMKQVMNGLEVRNVLISQLVTKKDINGILYLKPVFKSHQLSRARAQIFVKNL